MNVTSGRRTNASIVPGIRTSNRNSATRTNGR
jgi:hypothetical protein